MAGTRKGVIEWIIAWLSSSVILLIKKQHILWVYGYAGCGKSAIAQEISEQVQDGGRLLATFFFCRNAGDRSKIGRLPNTLASQMATSLPDTIPFIQAAVNAEPELLQVKSPFSLSARLQRLVYKPFKAAASQASLAKLFRSTPYLIIIDGLDECDDKEGVQEFITTTLKFFKKHPSIPLRILITSRVEQHIHSCLAADSGVILKDLADHCSRDDIVEFVRVVFEAETRSNPVIQAYMRQNGSWPSRIDSEKLVDHIGGSFIFAATLFKFIFQGSGSPGDCTTPLDRFPLALTIDPGLDGLYSATLARSEHISHFSDVISTITLLKRPLSISAIAELLGIQTHEVVRVLIDLQAVIQVPGTDDAPVTFYHTSLRDFLTNKSRSEQFFVRPSFHMRLCTLCVDCQLKIYRQTPKIGPRHSRLTAAAQYSFDHDYTTHWRLAGEVKVEAEAVPELYKLIQLRRNMLKVLPDPDRHWSLYALGWALESLFDHSKSVSQLEEAISMHREALNLRPHPHPDRHWSLYNLGCALKALFDHSKSVSHIEEAISAHREALDLRPHPHPNRHRSLYYLGLAFYSHFMETGSTRHFDEAVSLSREALTHHLPIPSSRSNALVWLVAYLIPQYVKTQFTDDLDEAITYTHELFDEHFIEGHERRGWVLENLRSQLQLRFNVTGNQDDLDEILKLEEEIIALGLAIFLSSSLDTSRR
ncbi:hypothetical protein EST38_g7303 [Candolleomyces aberdarensis]|uniref:Nephrocystin 3-like N-terminal domain-containing protein n=1 Tax=Candolleomyces aberdarensis TaxID=2316362 RepID=A0A4Q2DHB9_9AGAR|nr:hypothetical protein EST38_g7303 [Candolleomyces aberdarensis]